MRKFILLFLCFFSLSVSAMATNYEGAVVLSPDLSPAVVDPVDTFSETEVDLIGTDDNTPDDPQVDVLLPEEVTPSDQEEFPADSGSFEPDYSPVVSGTPDDPVAVLIIEPDSSYASVYAAGSSLDLQISDDPPSDPPFYGSLYVTGETSSGDYVTIYLPTTYKEGYLGVDSSGRLFNVSATNINGYYDGAYNNSFNIPAFSYPRYRNSSSSYDYTDLYIVPISSNAHIATATEGIMSFTDLVPYFSLLLLGVIFVCCMKRS